jgi:hypothetical protein
MNLSQSHSIQSLLRPAKGFSFGSAHRGSLMNINMTSPPAKYNIKGLVEINLNAKKGPSIGGGRENSVEKTSLSYIGNNHNVTPVPLSPAPATTPPTRTTSKPTPPSRSASATTRISPSSFSTTRQ